MQLSTPNNQSNYFVKKKKNNQITYISRYNQSISYESILFEIDSKHISHVFGVTSRPACLFKRSW